METAEKKTEEPVRTKIRATANTTLRYVKLKLS